ncbi:MAG TPA: STAS domain-containing protein [Acidobacteriaceae bacterium]|jgi:anti-sigma B factor antagonist|nr:STAS domain-containing protein [Acidobacteriaceae bacterium]
MRPLEIGYLKHGDVSAVTLQGGIVLGPPVDSVRQTLGNLLQHGENKLVLNLAGVDRLDSSGIGVLVWALQASKGSGGDTRLTQLPRVVAQTLKMCQLLPLFAVFDTDEAAIASFE